MMTLYAPPVAFPAVSIMGRYRDVTGQCVADVDTATRWMLGSEIYNSASNRGVYAAGTTWLDSCYVHGTTTDLEVVGAIYIRNLISGGVYIGTPTAY